MTLTFEPKTEQELNKLMDKGNYLFEVINSEDYISKASGKSMIKLTVTVWDNNGKERNFFDYLTADALFKVKHFCDAVGLQDKYNSGTLSAYDCMGKGGLCTVGVQKDKTGQYPDKNVIKDYVALTENVKKEEFVSDDVPNF